MATRCFARSSWLASASVEVSQCILPPFLAPSIRFFSTSRVGSVRPVSTTTPRHTVRPSTSTATPSPSSSRRTKSTIPSASTDRDTIFALATGAGRAGVAIIRISGPLAPSLYTSLCLTSRLLPYRRLPPSHRLVLRNIHHPSTRELLDSGAGVIHFPAGSSYTGEQSLELHVHGGAATITDILTALGGWGRGVRLAEPGEFTRRAFENGRLDLASGEALGGLVEAETSVQRRVALRGTQGLQARRFEGIREELLGAMAMTEAIIDFSDEDGVEEGTWKSARERVSALGELLRAELGVASDGTREEGREGEGERKHVRHVGEILTTGVRLAIYGPPNAGKSSLLNRLADRNAAIVSDIPGTTRDVLQVHLDLGGYKVIVYDTAGIRDDASPTQASPGSEGRSPLDQIERIGIDRAKEVVKAADLALLVLPADDPSAWQNASIIRPDAYTETDPDLIFYNKSDLLSSTQTPTSPVSLSSPTPLAFTGSVRTNDGISHLISSLAQLLSSKYSLSTTEAPLITQSRHRFHLHECLTHIDAFQEIASMSDPDLVLAAEELRYAAKAVGKVTGRDVTPDEILGSIFATFCIGK